MNKKIVVISLLFLSIGAFSQSADPTRKKQLIAKADETIYMPDQLDKRPDFPGGIPEFFKFVSNNFRLLNYDDEIHGQVKISFVVEADGSVGTVTILKDLHNVGAQAIKVMEKCPAWIPGELKGKKVRTIFDLPINF